MLGPTVWHVPLVLQQQGGIAQIARVLRLPVGPSTEHLTSSILDICVYSN